MKKYIVLLLVLIAATVVYAQDIKFHNANQFALVWEEVTTDMDGDPITGVTYEILIANADTDPEKSNPVVVYTGPDTQTTITLVDKGRYFVGARSVLGEDKSEINWADEPEYQDGYELFGIRFAVPPNAPKGLKRG